MIFTVSQLLAHAVGDYVIQSDWMATEKTKRHVPAAAHALSYALPFLLLRPSLAALSVIVVTHFVIDRWRLARYLCWAKNFLAPVRYVDVDYFLNVKVPEGYRQLGESDLCSQNRPWSQCRATGYPAGKPDFMAVWLMIIADNIAHVIINGLALYYL